MIKSNLNFFKKWFSEYCRSFYSSNEEDQKNIALKELHTHHVCKNIVEIASALNVSGEERMIAEIVGLFHDVGRFPQYAQYKTFKDSISTNHGTLGAKVLTEQRILQNLPVQLQESIIDAVRFHNTYTIPDVDERTRLYLKLVRDADKIDIWRVFVEYYLHTKERASAVSLGFAETDEYSASVLPYIFQRQMIPLAEVKTLTDFKLLQLSWVFDLNFPESAALAVQRGMIQDIGGLLPEDTHLKNAAAFVNSVLEEIAKGG